MDRETKRISIKDLPTQTWIRITLTTPGGFYFENMEGEICYCVIRTQA